MEASTPLGTSTLTTGAPQALMASIALATAPAGLPLKARAQQRIDDHRRALERPRARGSRTGRLSLGAAAPAHRRCSLLEVLAARPGELRRRRRAHHRHLAARVTQQPRRHQPVAAVVPLSACHRHRAVGRERSTVRATPAPARSIRSSDATPRSSIAQRSTARIVSASGSGVSQSGRAFTRAMLDGRSAQGTSAGASGTRCSRIRGRPEGGAHSTVTVFARLRG